MSEPITVAKLRKLAKAKGRCIQHRLVGKYRTLEFFIAPSYGYKTGAQDLQMDASTKEWLFNTLSAMPDVETKS